MLGNPNFPPILKDEAFIGLAVEIDIVLHTFYKARPWIYNIEAITICSNNHLPQNFARCRAYSRVLMHFAHECCGIPKTYTFLGVQAAPHGDFGGVVQHQETFYTSFGHRPAISFKKVLTSLSPIHSFSFFCSITRFP